MESFTFVGIDVSKDKFDVLILNEKKDIHKIFPNSNHGFLKFIDCLSLLTTNPWCCMEATGHYSEALAKALYQAGIKVSVENAFKIKSYARARLTRNKNDKIDSKVIAEYCKAMLPKDFVPRTAEQESVRELVRLLDLLKKQYSQLQNQLEATQSPLVKKSLKRAIKALEKQIEEVEAQLKSLFEADEHLVQMVNLLITIKGIGRTTAYKILAYLPNLQQFCNVKQFAAFVGLSPMQHQSGKMQGKTTLTKFGNPNFKTALYMPAIVAKNKNSDLKPFVQRLEKNGLKPKAIVGAVMRKLAHIIYGMLKHNQRFNPKLACKA